MVEIISWALEFRTFPDIVHIIQYIFRQYRQFSIYFNRASLKLKRSMMKKLSKNVHYACFLIVITFGSKHCFS